MYMFQSWLPTLRHTSACPSSNDSGEAWKGVGGAGGQVGVGSKAGFGGEGMLHLHGGPLSHSLHVASMCMYAEAGACWHPLRHCQLTRPPPQSCCSTVKPQ
ncbi:hypothetical protein ABBQ38_008690 [Trebouxia sp. C0009 RCD-2024]